mmetsp:Transcript_324/g.630  ORF Transcript_324/g.630 Transcript_324/m.630 type:complete len:561 (+) Transcript_324:72-1754(+)|eukprot:CAMPEP_0178989840 /NCGR_PEP_ID=MMETSP0795-20121207/4601_1 /TAXON_ID=88552 /ORGANISM="Amoebophrya sp., Strain Ameob2" /LENGTH=560 /DNA_ID=CAMNT_0020681293 /DNA_START=60 /DNA_END=1742 /DNA_ORIENTATION=-
MPALSGKEFKKKALAALAAKAANASKAAKQAVPAPKNQQATVQRSAALPAAARNKKRTVKKTAGAKGLAKKARIAMKISAMKRSSVKQATASSIMKKYNTTRKNMKTLTSGSVEKTGIVSAGTSSNPAIVYKGRGRPPKGCVRPVKAAAEIEKPKVYSGRGRPPKGVNHTPKYARGLPEVSDEVKKAKVDSIVLADGGITIEADRVTVGGKMYTVLANGERKELPVTIANEQHEVLWKYRNTVKDPIKRLQLCSTGDTVKKQVIRVSTVTCSEPGVSFTSRGDRISQKIWVVHYRDAQGRRRNKWFNCKHYVNLKDAADKREELATKRCMAVAVNWKRETMKKLADAGLCVQKKDPSKRQSGVLGVTWYSAPAANSKKESDNSDQPPPKRLGWSAGIACASFTGKLTTGKAARPVRKTFTLNTGNYDLNTDAGTELLETDLEELKQKAIAQRKKWEKACFIYEEAQAPQYTCKRKERLNDEAAVLEDIAPMAGKGIASKPLPIMDGSATGPTGGALVAVEEKNQKPSVGGKKGVKKGMNKNNKRAAKLQLELDMEDDLLA